MEVCTEYVQWEGAHVLDFAQTFISSGSGSFAVTTTSDVIGISVELAPGSSGKVTFGLTSVKTDPKTFPHGFGVILEPGDSNLWTVGIMGNQLALYKGDTFKQYEGATSHRSMYAKVFLEAGAKAKIVGVLTLNGQSLLSNPCHAFTMIAAAQGSEPHVQSLALSNSDAPAAVNLPGLPAYPAAGGAILMIVGLMIVGVAHRRGLWFRRGGMGEPFIQ